MGCRRIASADLIEMLKRADSVSHPPGVGILKISIALKPA
jgi:hypothetical protein